MNFKRGFISFLFLSFLVSNIIAQVNVPDTPYCEKSFEFLKNNCYECVNYSLTKKCKVEKFDFLGKANNKYYYYGVYLTEPFRSDYKFYHFTIYEGNSEKSNLKPVYFFYPRLGGYEYYDLKMTKTKYGYIIHIHLLEKAAGWDEGEYLIYRNGKWEKLREPNWFCAAESLLPEGYSLDFYSSNNIWIKIDLETMSIKIPVEKDDEPTGGSVSFNLAVEKDKFEIVNSQYIQATQSKNIENKIHKKTYPYCEKSIDFLKNNCYPCVINSQKSKFLEFEHLGDHNSKQYYYGLYQVNEEKDDSSYFIIYEGKKGNKNLKPIHFLYFNSPSSYNVEMTNTKYGLIIHIELVSGNGNWDNGEYIIKRNGSWKKLKMPNWNCVYEWIKPEDTRFCKGNYINLKEMTNTFAVYSYDDGCCCPTRGFVTSKLTIDDNGFRVVSSKYDPDFRK